MDVLQKAMMKLKENKDPEKEMDQLKEKYPNIKIEEW